MYDRGCPMSGRAIWDSYGILIRKSSFSMKIQYMLEDPMRSLHSRVHRVFITPQDVLVYKTVINRKIIKFSFDVASFPKMIWRSDRPDVIYSSCVDIKVHLMIGSPL